MTFAHGQFIKSAVADPRDGLLRKALGHTLPIGVFHKSATAKINLNGLLLD